MDYIIYHQVKEGIDCPDGISAAWVAKRALPEAKIVGWCYQTPPPDFIQSGDRVFIVDFSFPAAALNEWQQRGIEVTVIDHHQTALQDLSGLSDRILLKFDMQECGATLAWRHFFPDAPMPVFLEYVKDRDLWNFDLDETQFVHEAMSALGRKFLLLDRFSTMTKEELLWFLMPIGQKLLAPKLEAIAAAAARWEWRELAGYRIPCVQLLPGEDRLASDVCTKLYRELVPDAPFVAAIAPDGIGWSLRSDKKKENDFDVAAIAQQFGGGGHRNAAGFKLSAANN